MPEATENKAEQVQKQKAVEAFILAMATGAKTALLYKPGHTMIAQVAQRVHAVLISALGQDPNLTLDVKPKTIVFNEADLTPTPEMVSFASTLHTIGVGQILLTPRLLPEGLVEFFRVLNLKADDKTTLTDIQKAVQGTRIDGMQMVFVLSFVVTGEQEAKIETPGRLSEEQIAAFVAAPTLPDFLYLLFKQNEPLAGKDAESVTDLLDSVLNRELSVQKFQETMPWSFYDPRIRARWDSFTAPPAGGAGQKRRWDRHSLATNCSTYEDADVASLADHHSHEKKDALIYALDLSHHIIDNPAGEKQPQFAILAYARLLAELGHDGNVARLLKEYDYWLELGANGKAGQALGALHKLIQEKVWTPSCAANLVPYAVGLARESPEFQKTISFLSLLGENSVPLLLEELRKLADKDQRAKLCYLLTELCRKVGTKHLVMAIGDQDWFLVANVVGIIQELNIPELYPLLVPLLFYHHRKVRETMIRLLAKAGGSAAAEGLADFILKTKAEDEALMAVTSLSQTGVPGVEEKIVDAYRKLTADAVASVANYAVRVRLVAVLGRVASSGASRAFLEETAHRSFWELISGLNKDLRHAARESLEQMKREAAAHGKKG